MIEINRVRKIAIVYDWIDSWGGVERVLLQLHTLFSEADFYTSYVDLVKASWAKELRIYPSFIQRLPFFVKNSRILSLPLYPYAFEQFDLSAYDLVISVSSAFAKSVITKPHTKHICYLLTPPRYLWGMTADYQMSHSTISRMKQIVAAPLLRNLREFDFISAQRPDSILAISQTVANRCKKYYQRDADVLFPPFDIDYWQNIKNSISADTKPFNKDYYLVVSRLEPYKNVDLAIEAFNKSRKHLVIIGKGTQKQRLMSLANDNIIFIENISDRELAIWYRYAEALIMPQEEDFGYVAIEAQIMGCPVVAYSQGGASETVIENETGVFFASQSEKSLQEALERLRSKSYNVRQTLHSIEPYIKSFSKDTFIKRLHQYL